MDVVSGYRSVLEPLLKVPTVSTADVARCDSGSTSQQGLDATLAAVNYLRGLAALPPVQLDPALNAKAQAAALIMRANGVVTHDPGSNLRCYTKAGYVGASHGNLALSIGGTPTALSATTGPRAVLQYFTEDGSSNTPVGHRRWLLWQGLKSIGSGDTDASNSIYVMPDVFPRAAVSRWVSWPAAGFFPRELEPHGRWSLTRPGADFRNAKVEMSSNGESIPLTRHRPQNGYADNTLVWDVSLPDAYRANADRDYPVQVVVSGIRLADGTKVTRSWTTTLVVASGTTA